MKRINQFFMFTLLLSMIGAKAWAYDFVADNICYNIIAEGNSEYVGVAGCENNPEAITITNRVRHGGKWYEVKEICEGAFQDQKDLYSVTLPNTIEIIRRKAFDNCGITSISFPSSLKIIEDCAFSRTYISEVLIPASVESIGENAFGGTFDGCPDEESYCMIRTPEQYVVDSGNQYYSSVDGLLYDKNQTTLIAYPNGCSSSIVHVPSTVKEFYITEEDVILPTKFVVDSKLWYEVNKGVNPRFALIFDESDVQLGPVNGEMILPEGIERIGDYMFYDEKVDETTPTLDIKNITLPKSLKSIGISSFAYCSEIEAIEIPQGVISIGDYAFYGCSKLTSVMVNNETPVSIDSETFSNRTNATLYVPVCCKQAYESAPNWQLFKEIKEFTPPSVSIKMGVGSRDLEALGYSSRYGLDFTNVTKLKAYTATGYTSQRKVLLSRVKVVPPNTGIYITTTEPGCTVEVPTTDEDVYYANLLLPLVEAQTVQPTVTINGEEFLNFVVGILDKDNPDDPDRVGFIRVKKTSTVGPNRCVLPVPSRLYSVPNSVRDIDVIFDDEVTGISATLMNNEEMNNVIYDLQGRKIVHSTSSGGTLQKGVYIMNGKKVFVK